MLPSFRNTLTFLTAWIWATVVISNALAAESAPSDKALAPPKGQVELFRFQAKGDQIYEAKKAAGEGTFEWVLKAPKADLLNDKGEKVGIHYKDKGPAWEANDGSKIIGELAAKVDSPDAKAVPWLLLKATPNDGKGIMTKVSYVQRIDTGGGRAPQEAPKTADATVSIRYTATYVFYGNEKTEASKTQEAKSRTFLFTYAATVTGLPAGKTARIWLPMPPSNDDQKVDIVTKDLPGKELIAKSTKFNNMSLYVEAKAGADGSIPLKITYRITRREVVGKKNKPIDDNDRLAMFLQPDTMVPIDGKPLDLIKGKELPKDQMAAAQVLFDVVKGHMRYSKEGTGWGQGDSVWACDSKYGNCTDFHSLFISLARSQKIPSKFEIGFPIPEKRGAGDIPGYHCWAYFKPKGEGWIPVDISEAWKNPKMQDYYFGNLTEDRVSFSTGRDLDLVPKQAGKPLNFFIYPYVEVDDKPYAADKIQKKFGYEDVK
jgi:hypothetical protein